MDFAAVNPVAVLLAAVAAFAFGAVYYTVLGRPWMDAAGLTERQVQQDRTWKPFAVSFLSLCVLASVLAVTFGSMAAESLSSGQAVGTAVLLWLGLIVTSMATNHAFQGARAKLTVLDSGHWLGVMVVQALVLNVL